MKAVIKVLIIEDELPAVKRLRSMLKQHRPDWEVVHIIDTVEESVEYLNKKINIDLIFMDIQLADGHSFDIFNHVKLNIPVIFATAFNEFALKAFQVNGFDYILKPLTEEDFCRALDKYDSYHQSNSLDYNGLINAFKTGSSKSYKSRFLIKIGDQLKFVNVGDIAYFLYEDGYAQIITVQNDKFLLEESMDDLLKSVEPSMFFRINRKCIVHVNAIDKIHTYFNSRLKLELKPSCKFDIIVSRERVQDFKEFLGN